MGTLRCCLLFVEGLFLLLGAQAKLQLMRRRRWQLDENSMNVKLIGSLQLHQKRPHSIIVKRHTILSGIGEVSVYYLSKEQLGLSTIITGM